MYSVELYRKVRLACRHEGLSGREAARRFGIDRKTVAKILAFSVPPGYRLRGPRKRPKLDPFTGVIDRILEEDRAAHRKQRHTAKRIFERLRDEHGFEGGRTIVKDYVRERRRRSREMFVPLTGIRRTAAERLFRIRSRREEQSYRRCVLRYRLASFLR